MSDIVDRAGGVADIVSRGGRFCKKAFDTQKNSACACGRAPVYRFWRAGKETLECPNGCRKVGPGGSRQTLKQMWNFNEKERA